ncbi:MAG TPA: hypothetical protein PKL25_07915, partial [Phycicoccus elongatus]|nr:hypothetical protein [Phycicoccus elongatus]
MADQRARGGPIPERPSPSPSTAELNSHRTTGMPVSRCEICSGESEVPEPGASEPEHSRTQLAPDHRYACV